MNLQAPIAERRAGREDVRPADGLGAGLRAYVESVRKAPEGAIGHFARGAPCQAPTLIDWFGVATAGELEREGIVTRTGDDRCVSTLRLEVFNGLVSIMPARQQLDADHVHLNWDTFWLLELVWQHASSGTRAAELGTGNGIIAAHLVAKYRTVVATDLVGPWLHYAQLTLAANAARGRPSSIVACDVASALRPGCFDLVVANAPWSPAPRPDERGRALTSIDGGPTGTELPSRFIRQSARLLRPGGLAIVLCLDVTFTDGDRPLGTVLDDVTALGHHIEIIPARRLPRGELVQRVRKRLPHVEDADHVAMLIRAPDN